MLECQSLMLEINMIQIIGRRDLKFGPLTNLTDGGEGCSGYTPSEETKYKNGSANRGKTVIFTKEHINNLKGKHSKERVEINKQAQLKRTCNPDYKNPMQDKQHLTKSKQKISENRKGKCLGKDNARAKSIIINGKKYDTRKDAYTDLGITKNIFYLHYIKKEKK